MRRASHLREPPAVKALLILAALAYVALMLLLPLGAVLAQALAEGWQAWLAAVTEPDARSAIKLTLLVAGDRGAAQHGLRHRRGLGDRQARLSAARPSSSP